MYVKHVEVCAIPFDIKAVTRSHIQFCLGVVTIYIRPDMRLISTRTNLYPWTKTTWNTNKQRYWSADWNIFCLSETVNGCACARVSRFVLGLDIVRGNIIINYHHYVIYSFNLVCFMWNSLPNNFSQGMVTRKIFQAYQIWPLKKTNCKCSREPFYMCCALIITLNSINYSTKAWLWFWRSLKLFWHLVLSLG